MGSREMRDGSSEMVRASQVGRAGGKLLVLSVGSGIGYGEVDAEG